MDMDIDHSCILLSTPIVDYQYNTSSRWEDVSEHHVIKWRVH